MMMSHRKSSIDRIFGLTTYELYMYLKARDLTIRHNDIVNMVTNKYRDEPGWYGSLNALPPILHQKETIRVGQPMMPEGWEEIQVYALTGSQATVLAADIDMDLLSTIVSRVTALEESRIPHIDITPAEIQEATEAYIRWTSAGQSPACDKNPVKWVGDTRVFFYREDRYIDADGFEDPKNADFYKSSVGWLYDTHWGDEHNDILMERPKLKTTSS